MSLHGIPGKNIAGHLRDCASRHPGEKCNCEDILDGRRWDDDANDELSDAYREAYDPDWGS